jgi:class 3 adenylate cyclase
MFEVGPCFLWHSAWVSANPAAPPSGVVTFLFTDIEGSTRRWEADAQEMRIALARHDEVLRRAVESHQGWVFKHTGDGVCAAFADKEAFLGFVRNIPSFTKDGMHFSYELAMSEGSHVNVALFGESNATALSGKKYANVYCWLFRFADDKIALMREYFDTHLVRTAFFG